MADTVTPKMGLTKPEIGASANSWGNKLNENFNIIDNEVLRNTIQWTMTLGDEVPASVTGPFIISRFNNAGVKVDDSLQINRQTGDVIISNNLSVTKNLTITGTFGVTGAMTAPSLTLSGAFSALSAAITNHLTAASAAISGAISAASVTLSGAFSANAVTANTMTSNNTITAAGQITGNTMLANTITSNGNIAAVGRLDAGSIYHAGLAVWSPHNINPAINMRIGPGGVDTGISNVINIPHGHILTQLQFSGNLLRGICAPIQWQSADGVWHNMG